MSAGAPRACGTFALANVGPMDDADPSLAASLGLLAATRVHTLALAAPLSDADAERVHSPLLSPVLWDLGHLGAFEDLWLSHHHAGVPLLRPDLAETYDAFETPRAGRGVLGFLRRGDCLDYLAEVRGRALADAARRGTGDGLIHEMVLRHEHQHTETMLQTLTLARLEAYVPPPGPQAAPLPPSPSGFAGLDGLDLVDVVPEGPVTLGAPAEGFAYDNERPRHRASVAPFAIGRTPVTNGPYLAFVDAGGYDRREWWSDAGWAWRLSEGATRPLYWRADHQAEWRLGGPVALDPAAPVAHVSFYEAEAFARAHGARLPTEAEWEVACAWDPAARAARPYPWGASPPSPERANLDRRSVGPLPAGSLPAGASPWGVLGMLGDVWEWTDSGFEAYPGFVAHPYPEYSAVFFGGPFRVLRGGSWATSTRVATPFFRNWDLPERRQIFSGFRIARDRPAT